MILPSCCRMGGRHLYEVNVQWQWLNISGLHRTTYKLEGAHTLTNLFCGNKSAFLFLFSFSLVSVHLLPLHVNWGQSPLETLLAVVDVKPPPSLYSLINSLFDTVLKKLSGMPRLSVAGVEWSGHVCKDVWLTTQSSLSYFVSDKWSIWDCSKILYCHRSICLLPLGKWHFTIILKTMEEEIYLFPNFWQLVFLDSHQIHLILAGFLCCFLS